MNPFSSRGEREEEPAFRILRRSGGRGGVVVGVAWRCLHERDERDSEDIFVAFGG